MISIFGPCFVSYLHLAFVDFQVTSRVSDLQQLVVDKCESVMVSDGWWKLLTLACRCS